MFVGAIGRLYDVMSELWIVGLLLLIVRYLSPIFWPFKDKATRQHLVQWACVLMCMSFAWQSVNQILWGLLSGRETDIRFGMARFLLIIFPILFVQVILFLRRDFRIKERTLLGQINVYALGVAIISAFYTSIAAYKLADINTIIRCIYVPPADYHFDTYNTWVRNLCHHNTL